MPSIFDFELGDEAVPGYKVVADLGGTTYYRLLKVQGPDKNFKLWKRIDLTVGGAVVETRLLGLVTKLQHPYLNQINTVYKLDAGKTLILQTELHAQTLRERLQEVLKPLAARGIQPVGQGIPPDELLRYMENAAEAVDFLNTPRHEYKGERLAIFHRSIRPECLLLFDTPQGRVCRVSDFGLAKAVQDIEAAQHSLGLSQQEFSAPEFVDGHTFQTSDQFSLAAVYYFLRTNTLPYKGTLLQQMQAQMNDNPTLDLVPQAERDVIKRALSKDPNRRFESCVAFVQQLRTQIPRGTGAAGMQSSGQVATGSGMTRPSGALFVGGGRASRSEVMLPAVEPVPAAKPPSNPQVNLGRPQGMVPTPPKGPSSATLPGVGTGAAAKGPSSGNIQLPPVAPPSPPPAPPPTAKAAPKVYMRGSLAEMQLPPQGQTGPTTAKPPQPPSSHVQVPSPLGQAPQAPQPPAWAPPPAQAPQAWSPSPPPGPVQGFPGQPMGHPGQPSGPWAQQPAAPMPWAQAPAPVPAYAGPPAGYQPQGQPQPHPPWMQPQTPGALPWAQPQGGFPAVPVPGQAPKAPAWWKWTQLALLVAAVTVFGIFYVVPTYFPNLFK
jgi:serine/threonine-protein kinase